MSDEAERQPSVSATATRTPPPKSGTPQPATGLATTALDTQAGEDLVSVSGDSLPSDPGPDPWIGRVLSNVYRVESKIGEGGMGAVYSARHVHLQKEYAVKVLTSTIAKNKSAVERLKQEAIAASSIDHDNIVGVTNFDRTDDGAVYIVMELLKGESLASRIEKGPLAVEDAVTVTWQICEALHAAHERGIVHRDLKPENVFLQKRGDRERVKVLDFGISKVKSADAEGVRMTRTGQLVGTPLYMSPEQARGETDVDRRVDVYAMGVMLYEMLSGKPPFEGRNYFELLWKHGNEPPKPLEEAVPEVEPALGAVTMRALAKNKDERFATMDALADALEDACPGVSRTKSASLTSLPPKRPSADPSRKSTPDPSRPKAAPSIEIELPRPRPVVPYVVGAAVLVASLVGIWLATRTPDDPPEVATTAPPATDPGPVTTPDPPVADPDTAGVTPPIGVDLPPPVTVSFGSTPPGADVRLGETVICVTPCFYDLPAEEEVVLSFHRDGFLDQTRTFVPSSDSPVQVRLRRLPEHDGPDDGPGLPGLKTSI